MMSSTLGAPLGGTTCGGHHGLESLALRLIVPPNFPGWGGKYLPSIVLVAAGDPGGGAFGCAPFLASAWASKTPLALASEQPASMTATDWAALLAAARRSGADAS